MNPVASSWPCGFALLLPLPCSGGGTLNSWERQNDHEGTKTRSRKMISSLPLRAFESSWFPLVLPSGDMGTASRRDSSPATRNGRENISQILGFGHLTRITELMYHLWLGAGRPAPTG